ncbi:hypothetical protein ACFYO1_11845 [Nocardia sp. NPDC006044]|uniref:hypothetical protein n=1 Tax=Nocardia sp. NPDC006044 TaxID=3364306 RepID=UPI0036942ECA
MTRWRLRRRATDARGPAIAEQTGSVTLLDLADFTPALTRRTLHQLDRALAEN